MSKQVLNLIFTCCLFVALVACSQAPTPLPTVASVALAPTATPTRSASLPPTTDLTVLTSTPEPTAVPTIRPATPTATPAEPLINLSVPEENAQILLGSDIVVRGLAQREPADTIWVDLMGQNGHVLTTTQAIINEIGWEASLTVPHFVSGAGILQASIRHEDGEIAAVDQVPITLVLDTASTDRFLALYHPLNGETAVSGFSLFFDGRAQRPVNNTVTVSIWADECRNQVARQNFILRGSGYWQGFIIVPRDISGSACAIAYFGTVGEDTWREVQIPITVYPPTAEEAKGVRVGNPPAGSTFTAGDEILLYGTAQNVSNGTIQVSILLENGRIVSESFAGTDFWGYWETTVLLPFDVEGPAEITVSSGTFGESDYAEDRILITIEPAPTPTPFPTFAP